MCAWSATPRVRRRPEIGNGEIIHFPDTRKFNGLRVMMALMNSWDLKDENNAIYERDAG